MTGANWALVAAARDGGGRVTPARLRHLLAGAPLDEELAALARRGYKLKLTPRGSLELAGWPNRLFAEEITSLLGTDVIARRAETHWKVASTNDLARAEAAAGREGKAIFAEEQAAGRGRFGRRWIAPRFSSLLFSVALKSRGEAADDALALAGAVCVAEALDETCRLPARIRWPNDVLVEDRKISGVLVEGLAGEGGQRWLVAGFGVNVNIDETAFAPELADTATSISRAIGRRADRALVARAVLRRLDFWWEVLNAGESERLMEAWRRLSDILGTFVTVESRGTRHTGRVVDLDGRFGLVLQLSGGPTRAFAPAETTVIR